MPGLSLDLRTVILLIVVGNLVSVAVLAAYPHINRRERPYRLFIAGRMIQPAAWVLLALRREIPDLYSAYVGNTLLFFGFAVETAALSILDGEDRKKERLIACIAVIGSLVFWTLGDTPGQRVAIASLVTIALFCTATMSLIRHPAISTLRKMLAALYGIFCVVLAFRTWVALRSHGEMGLLTPHLVQNIAFLTLFLFMLLGTIAFLLLLKEQDDEQLRKVHHELLSREALLKNILDTSSVSVFLVDQGGRITMVNRRMAEMFGTTIEQLIGCEYIDVVAPEERELALRRLRSLLDSTSPSLELEREYRRNDGSSFWGQLTCSRMYDAESKTSQIVGVIADVTSRKLAEARIREMAQHDPLTGLPNRALFSDRLQQALAIAKRDKTRMALLFIDLDKFKLANDTYGHAIGDQLLMEAARRITAKIRQSDTAARVGGDEFVVLLRNVDAGHGAFDVAEKIGQSLKLPFTTGNLELAISASIGVAIYPEHGMNEIDLTRHADSAMYAAKRRGQDCTRLSEAAPPRG